MGKNISIYLDDDTLKWLEQLCKEWKMGKSEALQFVLKQSKQWSQALIPLLGKKNPGLADEVRKFVNNSE